MSDQHEVRSVLCTRCSTVYVSMGEDCPRCERDALRQLLREVLAFVPWVTFGGGPVQIGISIEGVLSSDLLARVVAATKEG